MNSPVLLFALGMLTGALLTSAAVLIGDGVDRARRRAAGQQKRENIHIPNGYAPAPAVSARPASPDCDAPAVVSTFTGAEANEVEVNRSSLDGLARHVMIVLESSWADALKSIRVRVWYQPDHQLRAPLSFGVERRLVVAKVGEES